MRGRAGGDAQSFRSEDRVLRMLFGAVEAVEGLAADLAAEAEAEAGAVDDLAGQYAVVRITHAGHSLKGVVIATTTLSQFYDLFGVSVLVTSSTSSQSSSSLH